MDRSTIDILMKILKCGISGANGEDIPCDSLFSGDDGERLTEELYALSKAHDIAQITGSWLSSHHCLDSESDTAKRFKNKELESVYRTAKLNYELTRITSILESEGIDHIPLKGSVIRKYYPKENMRTSCDIDILIHEDDLDTAVNALTGAGFVFGQREYHDVTLSSSTGVTLELHFSLLEMKDNIDKILCDPWKYATVKQGREYEFSKGFFFFHIMSHIYYHFLSGGCGLRALIDLYVIESKMGITLNDAKELLEEADILRFAEVMCGLSYYCFSDDRERMDKDTEKLYTDLLAYIAVGGAYGTASNKMAISSNGKKNVLSHALKRWLLPFSAMKEFYPVLRKVPVLLPVFWIVRLFSKLIKGETKNVRDEMRAGSDLDRERVLTVSEMKEKMGI